MAKKKKVAKKKPAPKAAPKKSKPKAVKPPAKPDVPKSKAIDELKEEIVAEVRLLVTNKKQSYFQLTELGEQLVELEKSGGTLTDDKTDAPVLGEGVQKVEDSDETEELEPEEINDEDLGGDYIDDDLAGDEIDSNDF